jgi:putative membrane protein
MNKKVALICLILYSCVAAWSAINPVDKGTRLIEFITSVIPVLMLAILYIKKIRFSSLGYILMTILPIMHVIGAHYTFANVPSQWLSDLL